VSAYKPSADSREYFCVGGLALCDLIENATPPQLADLNLAGGNMEGKEVRFGVGGPKPPHHQMPEPSIPIHPLHHCVPGRVRLEVSSLYRRKDRQERLEWLLPGRSGIRSARPNIRTGHGLIVFDPAQSIQSIIETVESALDNGALSRTFLH
jgi:hypothetical protein